MRFRFSILFLTALLTAAAFDLYGQKSQSIPDEGTSITPAIPPSPDAAALGKYGNIPVSPYTGIPDISVPLYTIKSGSISLPISLSYHAGGNKVEETASSVGLGWVLNAGGAITRTVRGLPDEVSLGMLDPGHYVPNLINTLTYGYGHPYDTLQTNTYLNEISDGTIDGEADMYNFNFAGYSGRFVMDSYGNVMVIPQQKIKFTFQVNTGASYIQSFTAVTPDGTTYVFGSDQDANDAVEKTYSVSSCSTPLNKKYIATSWFIKKITDPLGHVITFQYTSENYTVSQAPSQSIYQFYNSTSYQNTGGSNSATTPPPTNCTPSSIINGVKLSTISFENGSLNIYAGIGRADISGGKMIDSIAIVSGGFSKLYQLYHTNVAGTRLRLDSLIGHLDQVNVQKEKYSFQYNPDISLTSSVLFQQDWWGYYNAANNNVVNGLNTLVPTTMYYPYNSAAIAVLPGADRSSNEQAMLQGMLTKITYPEGGYTLFTYEANSESGRDLGGTSTKFPPTSNQIAVCNDPANGALYNYDINQENPNNYMTIKSPKGNLVAVGIIASGLEPVGGDPNVNDVTASLNLLDTLGNNIVSGDVPIRNTDTTVYLAPGRYQIVITDGKNKAYNPQNPQGPGTVKYAIAVNWYSENTSVAYQAYGFIVGGLRINQIADYDGVNASPINLKTYQYTLPGQNSGSGVIDFQPVYQYYQGINAGTVQSGVYTNTFLVRASVSNYPLATTQGSVVGYSHVTELTAGNGQNGKTEYFYTNSQTNPDLNFGTGFPFAPPMSHDWERGQLLRQITWRSTGGGTFSRLQDKVNTYQVNYQQFNNNIKAGLNPRPTQYASNMPYYSGYIDGQLIVQPFTDYTNFNYLAQSVTTNYDLNDSTKFVQTKTTYGYNPLNFLIRTDTTTNSKLERIVQNVTYPVDYTITGSPTGNSLLGLANLNSKGILSYPIEEVTIKSNADGTNSRTVKAVLTTYKPAQTVRDSVYEMRSVTPVTNFVNSSAGTNYINKDGRYQAVVSFDSYDAFGNILQERKVNDAFHSYIWGYNNSNNTFNNTYPIAEALNADANSIAYTNFESYNTNGYGNWTYSNAGNSYDATAPMGANCYSLSSSNALSNSALSSTASYVVSFWTKAGASVTVTGGTVTSVATGNAKSGWVYNEYSVTGTTAVTIGGSGLIDEVRLYPVNAQMNTYTYFPLVGIASKCDTKNDITYYTYDNVGRLLYIQDQNRNIIKQMVYHYKGQ